MSIANRLPGAVALTRLAARVWPAGTAPSRSTAPQVSHSLGLGIVGSLSSLHIVMVSAVLLTGCNTNPPGKGSMEQQLDSGGIPMEQDTADTGKPLDTNEDGEVRYPDDVWQAVGSGESGDFWETSSIGFSASFSGQGLQDLKLSIILATDSTAIEFMPADGCFDGLINVSRPDIAAEDPYCEESGYDNFMVCPSADANRLRTYIGSYTLTNEETGETQSMVLIDSVESLYSNPAAVQGYILGVFCGENPNPYSIEIPTAWNADAEVNIGLALTLFVETRDYDQNAPYETWLGARVIAE
jgi:hypothetical protein